MNSIDLVKKNETNKWNFPWFKDFFDFPFFDTKETTFLKTDIKELEKSYVLFVEVPGFKKEDIDISYENGYLTIKVCAKNGYNEKDDYIRKERTFMSGSRSFYVGNLENLEINASLDSGILNICIPKTQTNKENKHSVVIK